MSEQDARNEARGRRQAEECAQQRQAVATANEWVAAQAARLGVTTDQILRAIRCAILPEAIEQTSPMSFSIELGGRSPRLTDTNSIRALEKLRRQMDEHAVAADNRPMQGTIAAVIEAEKREAADRKRGQQARTRREAAAA